MRGTEKEMVTGRHAQSLTALQVAATFKWTYAPNPPKRFKRAARAQLLLLLPQHSQSKEAISRIWPSLSTESSYAPHFHLLLCSSVTHDKLPPCVSGLCNLASHLPASRNTIHRYIIWEPKARANTMLFFYLITTLLLAFSAWKCYSA